MKSPLPDHGINFNAPIPGQSLTSEPGAHPFEKPPQYTTVDEAMRFLFNQCTDTKHLHKILALLESGASVEAIVKTILFGGFAHGLWTVDLQLLLAKPTIALIMSIAKKAGIKAQLKMHPHDKTAKFLADLADPEFTAKLVKKDPNKQKPEQSASPTPPAPQGPPDMGLGSPETGGGFMSMGAQ